MTGGPAYSGTIPRLLAAAAQRDPDGTWLRTDSGALTFAAALGRAAVTARSLAGAGIGRGDLVVVTARNTPDYLLCWLALASLGAVTVPVNPRGAPAELAGLLGQVRPRALISDASLAALTGPALASAAEAGLPPPELGVLDVTGLGAGRADPAGADADLLAAGVTPDDLAVLIPTSGTTGRSKLVMQTHRAYAMAGEGFPFWMELTAADRLMTSLPLFHINAPAYSVMGSLACGAGLILLERFSASTFLDSARRHGATEFNAIGAMLEILMRQPPRPDDASTPLRLCYTGPAPERDRQEEMERRLGIRIVVGYAMSESPYGLIWAHGTRPFGTLGSVRQHPVLGVVNEAKVVSADGRELGPGETGELLLRNPVLTPGYWGMPEETAAAITGGWLHTGDLVTPGAGGTYTFAGRQKEVLRRRGENLSPLEVEEVLAEHPAVLECAVVGVESELSEDEVKAFIVPARRDGDGRPEVDFGELAEFAAGRLAAFKVPRYWQLIDELPRTPTARVAKHQLPAGHRPGEYDTEAARPR
ncbi:MAG TPA: AMP-binding protein [Streptosporangiaceae bacterium]|jgi:crotonobetaine/carnitine-CoA ligase